MMPLFLLALAVFLEVSPSAASRGEASLEPASRRSRSASGVVHECQSAVHATHTASETIKALKDCISMLEKFSQESDQIRKATKHDSQQYSSDMNLLGSFLQSLQGQMAATYHTDKKLYDQLRSKQQKALSTGLIQKHQATKGTKTTKASSKSKHHAHSLKQKVKMRKAHRKASKAHAQKALSQNGQHGQHTKHMKHTKHQHGQWKAPSFLQLSEDEHEELSKVDLDLRKLQESIKKQIDMADQQADAADAASGMLSHLVPATSLLQLSEGDGELADDSAPASQVEAPTSSSLLEEEAPGFASFFWKPWKLQDEKQTLHHIVGFGLTKDERQIHTEKKITAA